MFADINRVVSPNLSFVKYEKKDEIPGTSFQNIPFAIKIILQIGLIITSVGLAGSALGLFIGLTLKKTFIFHSAIIISSLGFFICIFGLLVNVTNMMYHQMFTITKK